MDVESVTSLASPIDPRLVAIVYRHTYETRRGRVEKYYGQIFHRDDYQRAVFTDNHSHRSQESATHCMLETMRQLCHKSPTFTHYAGSGACVFCKRDPDTTPLTTRQEREG
jgi:hypothetical protein